MRFVYLLLLLPYLLYGQSSTSVQKGWQELTISDGLSQGMIFDMKQDQKGFLWIATKDGLNRYDGYNFKAFTHDPYNPFSLSENVCTALTVDRYQRIWIGTQDLGLNLFDPQTERFYHISIKEKNVQKAVGYGIRQVVEDPSGAIWVSTEDERLIKIDLPASLENAYPSKADFTDQVKQTIISLESHNENARTNIVAFQPDGQLVAWASGGVFTVDWKQPTNSQKRHELDLLGEKVLGAYTDEAQQYWFLLGKNRLFGRHKGQWRTIPVSASESVRVLLEPFGHNQIAVLSRRYLWLMTPNELIRQDSLSAGNASIVLPLPNVGVACMLRDRTGNIWIGTMGYGLRKFNPLASRFHSYLPNQSLLHITVDKQGRIYLGQYAGQHLFDRETQQVRRFYNPDSPSSEWPKVLVYQDKRGFYWSYNNDTDDHRHRLLRFSADWKLQKAYPFPDDTRFGGYGNQLCEDAAGNLLIGAINGKLLRFNPQTEQFQVFDYLGLLPKSGAQIEVFAMLLEPDQTLWIGTQKGLVRVRSLQTKPTFTIYRNSIRQRQSLSEDFVLSLARDPAAPDRFLWVGTKGGGLDRLDKQTSLFTHFTVKQGLPNKVVYGILPDELGNLWMSTNRGIAQFNPRTRQFRNYTKADGLQDDEFNNQAYFKAPTGELFFGGINGLTIFRPSEIDGSKKEKPLAVIIGLKVNNQAVEMDDPKAVLQKGIEFTDQLDLAYDQNQLTLEFAVMDFTNVGKNRFRYRLDGIDRNWVEAGTNRFANYAQLPDGRYTLQMQGSTDGDQWSDPVTLSIRIHPPFYRTWWAYLVYLLIAGGIVWQFYRFQTQRLLLQQQVVFEQKEATRLAELDAIKTRFFTNISHEFRTPLTLILGPVAELKRQLPKNLLLEAMERNSQRLLTLINQLLDLSKLDAGYLVIEPEPGDLAAFFRTLASSFTSLADSRGILFTFDQNETVWWARFDHDKLEKITTNLLSNAIKFTPDGKNVWMQVAYPADSGSVILTVEDSGIGIAAQDLPRIFDRFYQRSAEVAEAKNTRSYEGTGIGLALVSELVKALGGTISAKSTEGVGTTIVVSLTLQRLTDPSPQGERPSLAVTAPPIPVFDAGLAEAEPDSGSLPSSLNKIPILLLIDDNADIRAYVRSVLQNAYQVIEAVDGQQGLEIATETTPDLVICDLMMPRLDGFGFCRSLKSQESTSHIPVVMLTAKATLQDRIEGFEFGADEYLTKPFNADELRVRVRNLLDKQERLQTYFRGQLTQSGPLPVAVGSTGPPKLADLFIQKCYTLLHGHIEDPAFDVEAMATQLGMSRRTLNRKLVALTSLSAGGFIRSYRLRQAANLLRSGLSPTETAYRVGFESAAAFSRSFREQFGQSPSEFVVQP